MEPVQPAVEPANPKAQPKAQAKGQPKAAKPAKPAKGKPSDVVAPLPPTPDFIAERLKVWEDLKKKLAAAPPAGGNINISLPDGKVIVGELGKTSPFDIAKRCVFFW